MSRRGFCAFDPCQHVDDERVEDRRVEALKGPSKLGQGVLS
jgi:hypothetical protein